MPKPFPIACHAIQFQGREREDPEGILKVVAEAGYDGFEGFAPQTAQELVEVATLAARYGLHLINVGAPTFEQRVWFNVTLGNHAVEVPAAGRKDFGGWENTDEDYQRAAASVAEAAMFAGVFHLKGFHHAHIHTMIETQRDAEKMLAACPDLYLLLDTGHLTCAGSDSVAMVQALGPRIGHVHLKDFTADDPTTWRWPGSKFWEEGRFIELGDGNMGLDVPAVLEALQRVGYDGWISVELDRATRDPVEAAFQNREYLRGLGY
jgi:sugar phosphate isomerase/epimerase